MRLIDADVLHSALNKMQKWVVIKDNYHNEGYSYDQVHFAIDNAPTVDAERHGHWEYNPKDAFEVMFELPKCSVCGHESGDALNYCSNCGAKMDEVKNNGEMDKT